MDIQEKRILQEILTGMGGVASDNQLNDCEKLIEKFNARRETDFLSKLSDEVDDVVEVVKEGRRGRKRKGKVRKNLGNK